MKNKTNNSNEYFDNCPICETTKKAEEQGKDLTIEELKDAFKKSKEKGAIVGGEMFEEN